jgi:phosphoglucomutase
MKELFDFEGIKACFKNRPQFKFLADSMCGGIRLFSKLHIQLLMFVKVTGPYAKRIFVEELGLPLTSIQNYNVLEDFGGSSSI